MTNKEVILGNQIFSIEEQKIFGEFSGDKNPIHLDFINARKTIPGECIVHGMHSFLWALELFYANYSYIHSLYKITFIKNYSFKRKSILFLG